MYIRKRNYNDSLVSQYAWSYRSPAGQEYIVGLYHGPESGHVVVYCNQEVVAIDFNVQQSACYTFFIEEDLCEVHIERKGQGFSYAMRSNRQVDTPFNRQRKQLERRQRRLLWRALAAFGGIAVVVAVLIWHSQRQANRQAEQALALQYGEVTTAKAFLKKDRHSAQWVAFEYVAGGQIRRGRQPLPASGCLPNGMPLEPGDEFAVRYHPAKPKLAVMNFEQPSVAVLARYRAMALAAWLHAHPQQSEWTANCLLDAAYELYGLSAYADVYWQDKTSQQNPCHNQETFSRLLQQENFHRLARERCAQ